MNIKIDISKIKKASALEGSVEYGHVDGLQEAYKDAKNNKEKLKNIRMTDDDFRVENHFSDKTTKCFADLKKHWLDVIPAKGYVRNRKKENKYDEIVSNNDPQSGGEAVYAVKSRRRNTYRHLIAALNRSANRDSFGCESEIAEALSLCRLPKDGQIADTLRHNLAILAYRDWTNNRDNLNEYVVESLTQGLAALRSISADFYKTDDEKYSRDLIEVYLCNALGDVSLYLGDTVAAYDYYTFVRDKTADSQDVYLQMQCVSAYNGLAELCLLSGDKANAVDLCKKAEKLIKAQKRIDEIKGFLLTALSYKVGYINQDRETLKKAVNAFAEIEAYRPCAEFVCTVYEKLFGEPLPVPPLPEPEPEDSSEEINETKADDETTQPEFINEKELYESLSGEEKRLYEITLCAPQKYQGKLYYMTERQIREKIDEAYKRHYELNIKYDAENDDDFNYHGDADSSAKYSDAIELLVDYYAMVNDIPNAVKEAKRLLDNREENVNRQGVYSRCYDYDAMVLAGYKVAWLTKDRRKFKEIIWKGRNCKMAERLKIMYSRCQFTDPPDDNEEPEWDEFRELTSKNGVDLTEGKTQRQIHDEFTLGDWSFTEDLEELDETTLRESENADSDAYYTFDRYYDGLWVFEQRRIGYYEIKERRGLCFLRLGKRSGAEYYCRSAVTGKYHVYIRAFLKSSDSAPLASVALSFYRLGYVTGHREPMDRALEYLKYTGDPKLNERIEQIKHLRDKFFPTGTEAERYAKENGIEFEEAEK